MDFTGRPFPLIYVSVQHHRGQVERRSPFWQMCQPRFPTRIGVWCPIFSQNPFSAGSTPLATSSIIKESSLWETIFLSCMGGFTLFCFPRNRVSRSRPSRYNEEYQLHTHNSHAHPAHSRNLGVLGSWPRVKFSLRQFSVTWISDGRNLFKIPLDI